MSLRSDWSYIIGEFDVTSTLLFDLRSFAIYILYFIGTGDPSDDFSNTVYCHIAKCLFHFVHSSQVVDKPKLRYFC